MSGLDNPRGSPSAHSARLRRRGRPGGAGPCFTPPIRGGVMCYGPTGAISRFWSAADADRNRAAFLRERGDGRGGRPARHRARPARPPLQRRLGRGRLAAQRAARRRRAVRPPLPALALRPRALDGRPDRIRVLTNPDHGILDSNPYGLLSEFGSTVVTDAGGNSLLRVRANGEISTLATFPSRSSGRSTDSVPTAVAAWPRWDWDGETPKVMRTGARTTCPS